LTTLCITLANVMEERFRASSRVEGGLSFADEAFPQALDGVADEVAEIVDEREGRTNVLVLLALSTGTIGVS
jgi:hypothetical protein